MRIIRYVNERGLARWGCVTGAEDAQAEVVTGGLGKGFAGTGQREGVARVLAPVEPRAIFCIGQNYRRHAEEMGSPIPERPVVFMKNPASVNGPGGEIVLPRCSEREEVDWECELAVVIGRDVKDISEDRALECVAGYTVGNDVSARWWQKKGSGGQWIRGKSFDTFCPLGPVLVTADEIGDPQDLRLTTTVNGQLMQDGHTSDMIFGVAELIAELSRDTTLLAGTVLMTGTPSGVGAGREPRVFLKDGDAVVCAIDGIGELRNRVVARG